MRALMAWVVVASGCGLFGDSGDDGYVDGDWRIERPAKTTVAPGETLEIDLEDVDVEPADIQLFVDDIPDAIPMRHARLDPDVYLDTTDAPRELTLVVSPAL